MNTSLTLSPNAIQPPSHVTLIADNPADMIGAQKSLILWCEQKIAACNAEWLEAQGNAQRAAAGKWSGEKKRWLRVAGRHKAKLLFYTKVKMALEAGYYIVPPFPGQVFAIRVKPGTRPDTHRRYHSRTGSSDHEVAEDVLPAGAGEYANPFPKVQNHERHEVKDGKTVVAERWSMGTTFLPIEFPIALAKPQILDATTRAMALKVFDRLSVLPKFRSPDPIVMGDISRPGGGYVSFFVAWWLDTRSL